MYSVEINVLCRSHHCIMQPFSAYSGLVCLHIWYLLQLDGALAPGCQTRQMPHRPLPSCPQQGAACSVRKWLLNTQPETQLKGHPVYSVKQSFYPGGRPGSTPFTSSFYLLLNYHFCFCSFFGQIWAPQKKFSCQKLTGSSPQLSEEREIQIYRLLQASHCNILHTNCVDLTC